MRYKFFRQTKKSWKPLTWILHGYSEADREVADVMCQGYKSLIVSIFFVGFFIIWDEWDDNDY